MKSNFLRVISRIRRVLNNDSVINFILIGIVVFIIFNETQEKSHLENLESLRLIAFGAITIICFSISFGLIARLYNSRKETQNDKKNPLLSRSIIIIGFISVIVLVVVSEFPIIAFYAIGVGLCWGVLYGLMWLIGKQGLKIWDIFRKHKRQKMFDYFTNRPENQRRDSAKNKSER